MIKKTVKALGLDYGLFRTVSKLSIGNIVSQGFRYAFWFLLMWVVSVEDYGMIRYAFTIASFLSLPVVSGFGGGITKFISEHISKPESSTYAFHAILLDLCALAVALLVGVSLNIISYEIIPPLALYFLIVLSGYNLYYAYVRGIMDIRQLMWFGIFVNGLRLATVGLMIWMGSTLSTYELMIAYALPVILAVLLLNPWKTKSLKIKHVSIRMKVLKEISSFSLKGFTNAFFVMFIAQANIIIIKIYFYYSDVAYYSLGLTVSNLIKFISIGIIAIQMPEISGFKKDRKRIKSYTKKYLRMGVVILGGVSLLLTFSIPIIFKYLIRSDYIYALPVTYILIPGAFFSAMFSILAATWIGYGSPEKSVLAASFGVPLILILNAVLIPVLGIYASAIAYSISQASVFFISYYLFRKHFV